MSNPLRAAVVGCGGIAKHHVKGYGRYRGCDVVALVDIRRDNAEALAREHGLTPAIYSDYRKMLRVERPDVVSICLWPHLHAPATLACARAGVRAVHCEKPMAPHWGEAQRMVSVCEKHGTQLTFNHQRRFLRSFQRAKKLVDDGRIGDLVRLEGACSNMIDWGTHWIDMMCMFNNETDVSWVMGQLDASERHDVFGLRYEHQAICQFKFVNDVRALLFTGADSDIGCALRLMGTEGIVEIRKGEYPIMLRAKNSGSWKNLKIGGGIHGADAFVAAIKHVLDCLRSGKECALSARNALRTTEVIFALYESSRIRGRINLPLKTKRSAFLSMLESGDLKPKRRISIP